VRSIGVAELEAGTLSPAPSRQNIENLANLQRALQTVTKAIGSGNGRLGLLVPDAMVRVAILDFETLPARSREAETLVRWRMKENLPFAPEEARVSYQALGQSAERTELLAIAAKNEVLDEYEAALEQMQGGSALVLPTTLGLLPLLPETGEAGQLLVHVYSGGITNVVVSGNRLRLWRSRWLGPPTQVAPEQVWREACAEALRILASCRDRLQIQTERVWLCGRPAAAPELRAELSRTLCQEIELLAPSYDHAVALAPQDQELFQRFGAPVAGLLSNSTR
jgi:hypothetical protein